MIRALALALLVGGCASTAATYDPRAPIGWSLIEPPARFDHPYAGQHTIKYVAESETRSRCNGIGCSYIESGECTTYIATDSVIPASMILRHEIGHCNGWTKAHEDGHLVQAN
jgi:hypothetical protein